MAHGKCDYAKRIITMVAKKIPSSREFMDLLMELVETWAETFEVNKLSEEYRHAQFLLTLVDDDIDYSQPKVPVSVVHNLMKNIEHVPCDSVIFGMLLIPLAVVVHEITDSYEQYALEGIARNKSTLSDEDIAQVLDSLDTVETPPSDVQDKPSSSIDNDIDAIDELANVIQHFDWEPLVVQHPSLESMMVNLVVDLESLLGIIAVLTSTVISNDTYALMRKQLEVQAKEVLESYASLWLIKAMDALKATLQQTVAHVERDVVA